MTSKLHGPFGLALGIGLAVAVAGGVAQSAPSKASLNRAIDKRVEAMKTLQGSMGAINAELKKPTPDSAAIAKAARAVAQTANEIEDEFPAGSGAALRSTSRAKDEIWSDKAGFTGALSNFQVQASKLNQAAISGDIEAVKAQVPRVGGACGGCHKPFRSNPPAPPAARPT